MFQNSLRYDFTENSLQTVLPASASPTIRRLSHSDCAQLINSGTGQQFLGRFASEFTPTAYVCAPVRLDSEAGLVEMLTRYSENTLATYTTTGSSVSGMSCSVSLPLMTKPWDGSIYFHVQYFGDELSDALQHVEAQLRHVATVHGSHRVMFRFCFPFCIDLSIASRTISADVLSGLEALLSEQTYIVGVDVERYMQGNS